MLNPPVSFFNVPHGDDDYSHRRWPQMNPSGFRSVVNNIDWTRLHIQAVGMHARMHNGNGEVTCGLCIRECLLNPIEGT